MKRYVIAAILANLAHVYRQVVKAEGGAQSASALSPQAYLYIFERIKAE